MNRGVYSHSESHQLLFICLQCTSKTLGFKGYKSVRLKMVVIPTEIVWRQDPSNLEEVCLLSKLTFPSCHREATILK